MRVQMEAVQVLCKRFALGLFLGSILVGCVSASFNYKWYYPNLTSYDGTLLDKTPDGDIDAHVCEFNPITKEHGCVVMIKKDFEALYTDYLDLQNKLNQCQGPTPPK